ncbi:cytochrome b/b6 domain-containing protein [Roseospira goensis]|uniref:Cytochrome b n=1 Tax=Roseospira goensis TaxID=391922 RepID=A0A7W6WK76_9PROT|nr:cytochrome b/b6 domain-containing protein [Roseospira goensis]MBB4285479.1 cytochrome b [Roseospira goensis]
MAEMSSTDHGTPSETAESGNADSRGMIQVWDPFVRIGHWILVAGFLIAYFTEGEPAWLHEWAGYAVAITILLRVVWGFIGSEHARFSDFVRSPVAAWEYIKGIPAGTAKRFIGHNPAGGLMALALMASLFAASYTGMAMIAQEGEGPLASFMGPAATAQVEFIGPAFADDDEYGEYGEGRERGEGGEAGEQWEELHEFFANLTLVLMGLHIMGFITSSFAHNENLVRAMIDGRKRA